MAFPCRVPVAVRARASHQPWGELVNESEVVTIPLAIAVIVLAICVVLLVSLAVTCVFFDRNGHLRRRRQPRREPWGRT